MKKNILFFASNLMYFKSLLPYIHYFSKKNHNIFIRVNFFNFLSIHFFEFYKKKFPQSVNLITKNTISYLALIYNQNKIFKKIETKIKFKFIFLNKILKYLNYRTNKFDKIILTTKDMHYRDLFGNNSKKYAVGYPPIPVFVDLNKKKKTKSNFLSNDNIFTKKHNIKKILFKKYYYLRKFSYISNINRNQGEKNKVIVFHPGGYRHVFTNPGENKINSYKIQKQAIEEICIPLLKNNLIPIIKIHPWHAIYHGYNDMLKILKLSNLEKKIFVMKPNESFVKILSQAKFVIVFGSSTVYELWSYGYNRIFFINFYGKKRSNKFSFLKKNFFNTKNQYEIAINSKKINQYFNQNDLKIFRFFKNLKKNIKYDYEYIINN
jgi:hypothetical protein